MFSKIVLVAYTHAHSEEQGLAFIKQASWYDENVQYFFSFENDRCDIYEISLIKYL